MQITKCSFKSYLQCFLVYFGLKWFHSALEVQPVQVCGFFKWIFCEIQVKFNKITVTNRLISLSTFEICRVRGFVDFYSFCCGDSISWELSCRLVLILINWCMLLWLTLQQNQLVSYVWTLRVAHNKLTHVYIAPWRLYTTQK